MKERYVTTVELLPDGVHWIVSVSYGLDVIGMKLDCIHLDDAMEEGLRIVKEYKGKKEIDLNQVMLPLGVDSGGPPA